MTEITNWLTLGSGITIIHGCHRTVFVVPDLLYGDQTKGHIRKMIAEAPRNRITEIRGEL